MVKGNEIMERGTQLDASSILFIIQRLYITYWHMHIYIYIILFICIFKRKEKKRRENVLHQPMFPCPDLAIKHSNDLHVNYE